VLSWPREGTPVAELSNIINIVSCVVGGLGISSRVSNAVEGSYIQSRSIDKVKVKGKFYMVKCMISTFIGAAT